METCSSDRCAATFRAKCNFHCSVLLCKTGSQQAVFHCSYIYGDLLFIQVCSDPAQMQCSSVEGKMQFPLFSTALQNRITAGSVHCSYTYGDLLFIQVCSDPAPMHWSSIEGKIQSPLFSAALQNRLTAGTESLQLHLWRLALHTGVQ